MTSVARNIELSIISDEEILAQDLVKRDEIDQAIALYQSLGSGSARILYIIGGLYAEKKGDYHSAIDYYKRALEIQENNGDDTSDVLTKLAFAYQNLREYDLALTYHIRALSLRELIQNIDQRLVATNLFGIANVYWGQENLSEALIYAQRALTLNQSIQSENDLNIATNLAILANIYHDSGDNIRALKLSKRALTRLEHCAPPDSLLFISLLNNIGTIQVTAGLFDNALLPFIRALHICERTLPKGHPKRRTIENNIQRLTTMHQYNVMNSFSHFHKVLTKFLFL